MLQERLNTLRSRQDECFQAAYLADNLIFFQNFLTDVLALDKDGERTRHDRLWTDEDGVKARGFIQLCNEKRPDFGRENPRQRESGEHTWRLFQECNGKPLSQLDRRLRGEIEKCVTVLRNWIVRLSDRVEMVTGRRSFEWLELANHVADPCSHAAGYKGRLRFLRQVADMLDAVFAADFREGVVGGADNHNAADEARRAAVGGRGDAGTTPGPEEPGGTSTPTPTESGDSQEREQAEDVDQADPRGCPVQLQGLHESVIVLGKEKPALKPRGFYEAMKRLVDAYPDGLSLDKLERHPCGAARKYMAKLCKNDADWKKIIHFPGTKGEDGRQRER